MVKTKRGKEEVSDRANNASVHRQRRYSLLQDQVIGNAIILIIMISLSIVKVGLMRGQTLETKAHTALKVPDWRSNHRCGLRIAASHSLGKQLLSRDCTCRDR